MQMQGQIITTVVGGGNCGSTYCGDGGLAINAEISNPLGIIFDVTGNLFICDYSNNKIRKVDTNGIISKIAGNGNYGYCNGGYSGDGGQAINAKISLPEGIALDAKGNIYIADWCNNRVRKIDSLGIITTIAGNGIQGFSGDGGPATAAKIIGPDFVVLDKFGNIYISDTCHLRKIDTSGIITTIAGTGGYGYAGDGGPAISAKMANPGGLAIDSSGNFFISEINTNHIRKIDTAGIITTIAGTGVQGYSGDGGPAIYAELNQPVHLVVDDYGNIYFSDAQNNCIRKIDKSGIITTVVGNGIAGFSGDGGLATLAKLKNPYGIAIYKSDLYFADLYNNRIRKVTNAANGINQLVKKDSRVNIYPNPTTLQFYVETNSVDKASIDLFDFSGKHLLEKIINDHEAIYIDNFDSGIYMLSIKTRLGVEYKKLVIQK